MKRIIILLLIFSIVSCGTFDQTDESNSDLFQVSNVELYTSDDEMAKFYKNEISDQEVLLKGEVDKILSDDNEGSRHQRFILRLGSGQTLLIAHNIDLAPRVSPLTIGDPVEVYGEYEWNNRGGVVHWTHHDPQNQHFDGYIRFNGQLFQ